MTTSLESGGEGSSRVCGSPVPPAPAPVASQGDIDQDVFEERLEHISATIQEFALLHFGARAPISVRGDIVDAIAAGVNYLGEELEASYSEIEKRVADRTVELSVITKELAHRSLHDELTGLPNRTLFWDRLSHRMSLAGRRQTGYAVVFIDLDKFKEINDTFGHAVGDRLLVDVASRIRGGLRAGDSAARMGGDEFLVLLDDVATPESALTVANRLNETLANPYELGSVRQVVTTSMGIAIGPEDFTEPDEVVAAADAAMYKAKKNGRGQCELHCKD